MTEVELEKIEKRAEAASPGPWTINAARDVISATTTVFFGEPTSEGNHGICGEPADLVFLVNARSDVPALIAAIRALQEEAIRYRVTLEWVAGFAEKRSHLISFEPVKTVVRRALGLAK